MKILQSTTEGIWIELKPVELTEEQRLLFRSTNESDATAKSELMDTIRTQRELPAQQEDEVIATSKYDEIKPTIKQGDVYQLITCDVSIGNGISTGILNCRVNGEHIQIRF